MLLTTILPPLNHAKDTIVKNAILKIFRNSPDDCINPEVESIVSLLQEYAHVPPATVQKALQVLELVTLFEESQPHRNQLLDYLGTQAVQAAGDHAVDVLVAAYRSRATSDAWLGYRLSNATVWEAAKEMAGPAEDVTSPKLDTLASYLVDFASKTDHTVKEAMGPIFLERVVRIGVPKNLSQVPENTITRGFPRHFRPGQFFMCKSLALRTLRRWARTLKHKDEEQTESCLKLDTIPCSMAQTASAYQI